MKQQATIKRQKGFTIVELMIATAVFSFILLIATNGIIKIGQLYYKGVTQARTQEAARNISDELSRSLQFANGYKTEIATGNPTLKKFCLGDTRYSYTINAPYTAASPAPAIGTAGLSLERLTTGSACGCTAASCVAETKQLLGVDMRLLKLDINQLGAGIDKAWNVDLRIAYGQNDLFSHYSNTGVLISGADVASATCKSGIPGGSFCATAELDTIIKKRLN